jgi:hypothetical protein
MAEPVVAFTACHRTGADPKAARDLLEELADSYPDIDAAARLAEPDGRCIYVIVRNHHEDALAFLRAAITDVAPQWQKLVYFVGDPET